MADEPLTEGRHERPISLLKMSIVDTFKIGYAQQQVAAGLQIQGFGNP